MKKAWLLPVVSVALFSLAASGQFFLRERRFDSSPALAESAFAALGAFRSVVSEIVWFRADRLREEGRYVELAQLASLLVHMEPHTPEVWSYSAWNMAYNISIMMSSPADRWRWVHAALKLLRDKGLKYNPREAELYREVAWMFEVKIGADIDSAAKVYREKWAQIVRDVSKRGAWHELGMDAMSMLAIERHTGFSDWTNPQLSAIYWAYKGLPFARGNDKAFLNSIIKQAKVLYVKTSGNNQSAFTAGKEG